MPECLRPKKLFTAEALSQMACDSLVNASGGSLAVVEFVYCLDLCGLLWAACFKFQAFIGLPPGIVT